jgi:4-amino-4-deoxy-L-arabinose transferase-like glycosyltransferase
MSSASVWAGSWASPINRTCTSVVAIGFLIAFRFVAGAALPIYYNDEAYYWLWSRHLALGYFDHPPAVAFLIRAGTALFGDTAFGVRSVGIALVSVATFCVWRTASLLLGEREDGVRAALFYNLMLMPTVTAIPLVPDPPALACSAAFMWALAELAVGGKGWWWLVAGLFAGMGLLSKYTMFFFCAGAVLWLLLIKDARPWLKTVWPWIGGVVALILFLPNIVWNAQHGWETFAFQFGRIARVDAKLWSLPEFVGGQIVGASPIILFFALRGFWRECKSSEKSLLAALLGPSIAYFMIHALHGRVHVNWVSFVYPTLAVSAADGFRSNSDPRWVRAAAIPVATVILALSYAEGFLRVLPLDGNKRVEVVDQNFDPGMRELAAQVLREASSLGAHALVTADYRTTAWLKFYLPTSIPVIEATEEFRYPDAPRPTASDLAGTLLYVGLRDDQVGDLADHFSQIDPLAKSMVDEKNLPITPFILHRLQGFHGEPFGRLP